MFTCCVFRCSVFSHVEEGLSYPAEADYSGYGVRCRTNGMLLPTRSLGSEQREEREETNETPCQTQGPRRSSARSTPSRGYCSWCVCSHGLVSWNNNERHDYFVRMTAHPSDEDRGIGKRIRYCSTPCSGMATHAWKIDVFRITSRSGHT